jgi:site-specific DNA-adenine methylase
MHTKTSILIGLCGIVQLVRNQQQREEGPGHQWRTKRMGKSVWGNKSFGGYAGLKHTALKVSKYFPQHKIYVEAFAGLARTAKFTNADKIILNDKSLHSNAYCKVNFPNAIVENMDFMATIHKYDSEDTFFLLDPPYSDNVYKLNENAFIDRYYREYYKELFNTTDALKGDWLICVNRRNFTRFVDKLADGRYNFMHIQSDKNALFGKKANITILFNYKVSVPYR